MDIFKNVSLEYTHRDLFRNIVSLRESQDLFDDLSTEPSDWELAQRVEGEVKPPYYQSQTPVIYRPFEDAQWAHAISYPFKNWQRSRFSDGSFGVWYGSDLAETTVYETAYHWHRFLCDAHFDKKEVPQERKIYSVFCDASLLDFRPLTEIYRELIDKTDYGLTHSVGAKIHHEGHPGLLTISARHKAGTVYAIFNPNVLSNARYLYALTYRLQGNRILVEKIPGTTWLEIFIADL